MCMAGIYRYTHNILCIWYIYNIYLFILVRVWSYVTLCHCNLWLVGKVCVTTMAKPSKDLGFTGWSWLVSVMRNFLTLLSQWQASLAQLGRRQEHNLSQQLVVFCGLGAWWSAIQLWQVEEVGRKSTRGCRPGTRQHPFFEKLSHYLSVSRRVECPMKCP